VNTLFNTKCTKKDDKEDFYFQEKKSKANKQRGRRLSNEEGVGSGTRYEGGEYKRSGCMVLLLFVGRRLIVFHKELHIVISQIQGIMRIRGS
jgi:hypothetical protein